MKLGLWRRKSLTYRLHFNQITLAQAGKTGSEALVGYTLYTAAPTNSAGEHGIDELS